MNKIYLMKRSTISAAILLAIVFCEVHAQSEWVVRFNDGSEKAFDIESIKEMYPRNKTAEMNPKVRIAIFETISGYSVRNVMFYDAAANITPNATLFTTTGNNTQTFDFGCLNYTGAEDHEKTGTEFLGRTSVTASFAGNAEDNYYTACLPNEENEAVFNLRVTFSLEATDGSGEIINTPDATAQIPATYTQWKRGNAYTYIFKITETYLFMLSESMIVITLDSVIVEKADGNDVITR
jgi:hypothetical protein